MRIKADAMTDYKLTGYCTFDIEKVVKGWNHNAWISQYDNEYRLIQYVRRGSGNTDIKASISPEQAREIIKRLNLQGSRDVLLVKSTSWRRAEDWEKLYGPASANKRG